MSVVPDWYIKWKKVLNNVPGLKNLMLIPVINRRVENISEPCIAKKVHEEASKVARDAVTV